MRARPAGVRAAARRLADVDVEEVVDIEAREHGDDGGALAFARFESQTAAAAFDEQLDDGEADAEAGLAGRGGAVEQFEHVDLTLGGDTDAVVGDAKLVALPDPTEMQRDARFALLGIAVAQGVGDEAVENVAEAGGKPIDVVDEKFEMQDGFGGAGEALMPAKDLLDERADGDRGDLIVGGMVAGVFV